MTGVRRSAFENGGVFASSVEAWWRFRKKERITTPGLIIKAYPPELMDALGIKDDDGGQLVSARGRPGVCSAGAGAPCTSTPIDRPHPRCRLPRSEIVAPRGYIYRVFCVQLLLFVQRRSFFALCVSVPLN